MRKPLILGLTLSSLSAAAPALAAGEDPVQPLRGEWKLTVEQSYAKVLTLEKFADANPEGFEACWKA